MAVGLRQDQLKRLARLGAEARIRELQSEIEAIRRAFPDLGRAGRGARRAGRKGTSGRAASANRPRRRRRLSAAARKAISDRMKKYWASRRSGK